MPVVRTRGERIEGGRGYPRLKWSDLAKSIVSSGVETTIADPRNLSNVKNCNGDWLLRKEWQVRKERIAVDEQESLLCRRGEALYSDPEDSISEESDIVSDSNGDAALTYSDFRTSPEIGEVRMAFKVPLTKMTTLSDLSAVKKESRQANPLSLLGAEFRRGPFLGKLNKSCVGDSTMEEVPESETREKAFLVGSFDNKVCRYICGEESAKSEKNPRKTEIIFLRTKSRRNTTRCDTSKPNKDTIYDCNRSDNVVTINPEDKMQNDLLCVHKYNPNSRVRNSHRYKSTNKDAVRTQSFWHEIKTGGQSCLYSQRSRLREGTFIISPAETTARVVEETARRCSQSCDSPSCTYDHRRMNGSVRKCSVLDKLYYLPKINLSFPPPRLDKYDVTQSASKHRVITREYNRSSVGSFSDPLFLVTRQSDGILCTKLRDKQALRSNRSLSAILVDRPYDAQSLDYYHRIGVDSIASTKGLCEVSYVSQYSVSHVPRSSIYHASQNPACHAIRYSSTKAPFLITTSVHVGPRCYPSVHCHPLPKNPTLYPGKNFLHPASNQYEKDTSPYYTLLTKCHPTVSNKPSGVAQCLYSSRCPHHPNHYSRPLKPNLLNKRDPSLQVGLTFRNRHALLNSVDNLTPTKGLRKNDKRDAAKKSWLSLLCLQNFVGQRNSSGVGALPTKRPTSHPVPKSSTSDTPNKGSSAKGSPAPSSTSSSTSHSHSTRQQVATSSESRRSVKTSLKTVTGKNNLKARVGSSTQQKSGLISPAILHGRILQKTATVSPAPSDCLRANGGQVTSLPRFGFKRSSALASGESTDSVNSILSDAQTTSSSNSNIYDFSEENGNVKSCRSSMLAPKLNLNNNKVGLKLELDNVTTYQKFDNNFVNDLHARSSRESSPCNISQASSGVTSSAINGKLKTQTRQLPEPQIVTVKSVNCKAKSNLNNNSPNISCVKGNVSVVKSVFTQELHIKPQIDNKSNPAKKGVDSQSKFNLNQLAVEDNLVCIEDTKVSQCNHHSLVMPKVQVSKIPQSKSSLQKSQRVSRDSESSSRSINTLDSGLGSSSESDKSKASDSAEVKRSLRDVSVKDKDIALVKGDKVELDISDEWLKEKHSCLTDGKAGINNASFRSTEKKQPKDSFKEKRDTTITYGMARQKFAPYNRPRISYQNAISKTPTSVATGSQSKMSSSQNGKVVNTGLVRNRIAQIEKTPEKESTSAKKTIPKKPFARPTTIEKTPIVVTPTSENTVELSRPICRRLEYSEIKNSRLESRKADKMVFEDNKGYQSKESSPTAQDYLIVASYELKKNDQNNSNEQIKPSQLKHMNLTTSNSHHTIKTVCIKDETADLESDEEKRLKDLVECEIPMKRESDSIKNTSSRVSINTAVESQEVNVLSAKEKFLSETKLSPYESEASFEILESPGIDICTKGEANVPQDYLSKLIVDMANQNSDVDAITAKHSQESPIRAVPIKKIRNDLTTSVENEIPPLSKLCITEDTEQEKQTVMMVSDSSQKSFNSISLMSTSKSSVDSNGLDNIVYTPRRSDSCDRSGISGKCTPTLSSSNRCDMDQDFLIDDEISDQPGLTFGDDLDNSFLGDELLFPDEISTNSILDLKTGLGRSRHESMGTVSNISGDDLMLDYDAEDHHTVSRAYEEDVLSPVACEIFNEWTAMMAEVKEDICTPTCVSLDAAETVSSSSTTGDLNSSAAFNFSSVNAHQPLGNGFNPAAAGYRSQSFLSSSGCCRPKSFAGPSFDHSHEDHKKGLVFKPPRQAGGVSEQDGGVTLDRTSFHYICQDVTAMKTLLFRLRRILQVAETINPFDPSLNANMYMSLGANEMAEELEEASPVVHLDQENVDLKRQVVLLQQRLEEKDRSIRILQQQLAQALQQHQQHCSSTKSTQNLTSSTDSISTSSGKQLCNGSDHSSASDKTEISNAATQTERTGHQRSSTIGLNSSSRASSIEDGLGPTVSSDEEADVAVLCNRFDSDFLASDKFCLKFPPAAPPSEVHINSTINKSSSVSISPVVESAAIS